MASCDKEGVKVKLNSNQPFKRSWELEDGSSRLTKD